MFVRSATGVEAPGPGQPSPAPARWHLRTQVSRKTLFDLIQDTLPPGALSGAALPGEGAAVRAGQVEAAQWPPPPAGDGVLPQVYLDPNAATMPISLNPATLWNDGDTTPDLPEPWRPITITLASAALAPAARVPVPPPLPLPGRPLRGVAGRAGWMLAGVALTFLVSAAAFGGGPMIQAVRSVLTRPRAQAATLAAAPAVAPTRAAPSGSPPAVPPAGRPASRAVVTAGEPVVTRARAVSPAGGRAESADGEPPPDASRAAGPPIAEGDRRAAGGPARGARRPRPDRRASRPPEPAADPLLGEDAVMPLEAAAPLTQVAHRRPASPAIAKSLPAKAFRPIDVEDPFGGQ